MNFENISCLRLCRFMRGYANAYNSACTNRSTVAHAVFLNRKSDSCTSFFSVDTLDICVKVGTGKFSKISSVNFAFNGGLACAKSKATLYHSVNGTF